MKDSVEFSDNFAVWDYNSEWDNNKDLLHFFECMKREGFSPAVSISEFEMLIFEKRNKGVE